MGIIETSHVDHRCSTSTTLAAVLPHQEMLPEAKI